jgi:hypothetical protein
MHAAPMASRAKTKKHTSKVTTGTFPARWLQQLIPRSSRRSGFLSPSSARCESIVANLTPASRRLVPAFRSSCTRAASSLANFGKKRALANSKFQCRLRFEVPVTDWPQILQELQIGGTGTTWLRRPHRMHSSVASKRPSHPAPNVRDDRERPSQRVRNAQDSAGDLGARSTATDWHDGQIKVRLANRVKCQANGPVVPGRCTSICAFSPPWPISKPSDELKPARHVMVDQGGGTDRIDRLAPITEIPSFAEVLWY